ncbi:ribosomal large subunit pseudouridine synthase C [Chlamydia felis Fe/C-56]|uniref:Ribosomal large subunit pseudouridine synthase C n=1 Tax=Chlamydia felis (strain Fe/C-56) TaxID=264202 RepID=Q253Z9_CHLFF|nr:RluA family pseudouridine synthase [Chlamydia felis]BAE81389.1 ribosomal large subunit pseudouridine synthase C [Chlamydia felis Fe/C-56]
MKEFSWVANRVERLSSFLRSKLPDYTKQIIFDSIRYHGCRVNGRLERFESYKVQPGDCIALTLQIRSEPKILWEDQHCCIYDKPTHTTTEDLAKTTGLHIVHRLDRDTTGCILFAKNTNSAHALSELFKKRKIHKQYTALVFGHPKKSSGTLISYTAPKSRRCGAVIFGNTDKHSGKLTITHWSVLHSYKHYTLMLCQPFTGRTHQIRLHMHMLGNPIVGDLDYGRKEQPKNIFRPLLHAHSLTFTSPLSQEKVDVVASSSGDPRKVAPHLLID